MCAHLQIGSARVAPASLQFLSFGVLQRGHAEVLYPSSDCPPYPPPFRLASCQEMTGITYWEYEIHEKRSEVKCAHFTL